jgi:hypothetical protein
VDSAVPFQSTVEVDSKPLPLTVNVNAAAPAVAVDGDSPEMAGTGLLLSTLKVEPAEVPPPGAGLLTVTLALPALAIPEAGTAALTCVALTYVVDSAVPFQFTAEADSNPLPFTVSVNAPDPAVVELGDKADTAGIGLLALMSNVEPAEVPPPGDGLTTVTLAVPAVATPEAGTDALTWLAVT